MPTSLDVSRTSLYQQQAIKAAVDPIEFFPYEVFSRIIQFACCNDYAGGAPLEFLAISSRWKTTILETPEAWSYITVDDSEDIVMRTEFFIQFSRNNPIDLRVARLKKSESIDALKLVLKEDRRIRSLFFRLRLSQSSSGSLDEVMVPGHAIFGRRDATLMFPILQEITLGRSTTIPKNLLSSCPKLQRINGGRFTASDMPSLSRSVREIEFYFAKESELRTLADRTLTSLKLDNTKTDWTLNGPFNTQFIENNSKHLKWLWVNTWNLHKFVDAFLTITPSRLEYLRIQIPFDMIEYFLSSLYYIPQLQELSVHLSNSYWRNSKWPVRSPPQSMDKPSLRKLWIYDDTDQHNRDQIKEFVRCSEAHPVILNCEQLRVLSRGSLVEFSLVTSLLHNMSRLRALRAILEPFKTQEYLGEGELRSQVVMLPSVELLVTSSLDCLRLIRTPNLKDLTIRNSELIEAPFPTDALLGNTLDKLEIGWESLEKMACVEGETSESDAGYKLDKMASQLKITELIWRTWDKPCESFTAALGSLTTITLPSREIAAIITHKDNPLNSLCLVLLKGACPLLQTINSSMYPLWDLLFAALQFRLKSQDVKSIITISLPQFPSVRILRCLVELLKGSAETFEVGFDSLIKKRLDEPSACIYCLWAGYTHCLDTLREKDSDSNTLMTNEMGELELYAESTQKEVTDWEEILAKERREGMGKFATCNRHRFNSPTTINSFTPIGT